MSANIPPGPGAIKKKTRRGGRKHKPKTPHSITQNESKDRPRTPSTNRALPTGVVKPFCYTPPNPTPQPTPVVVNGPVEPYLTPLTPTLREASTPIRLRIADMQRDNPERILSDSLDIIREETNGRQTPPLWPDY